MKKTTILITYESNKITSTMYKIKSNRTSERNEQIYILTYYWQTKQTNPAKNRDNQRFEQ